MTEGSVTKAAVAEISGQRLVFRPFELAIPYELVPLYPALRPRSRLVSEFAVALKVALQELLEPQIAAPG